MTIDGEGEAPIIGFAGAPELRAALARISGERFQLSTLSAAGDLPERLDLPPRLIVLAAQPEQEDQATRQLRSLRGRWPMVDCLAWAPAASAGLVRSLLRGGARDVVIDDDVENLFAAIDETLTEQRVLPAVERLAEYRVKKSKFEGMLSRNHTMWDLFETIARVAATDANVLVCGETGTGKELFARALHRRSGRKGRFVALNCSALPDNLVESELFGHEKGAFTGAAKAREGIFRHAEGGTVFLDEIGDMPESAQQNLLRVIEERRVRPVGAAEEVEIDVRIVAATHVGLEEAVANNQFREDLFYRLDVIRLDVPPLRDRPEDIVYLFGFFLKSLAKHYGVDTPRYDERFIAHLVSYDWPGNVRELENFSERVVLRSQNGRLRAGDFEKLVGGPPGAQPEAPGFAPATDTSHTPPGADKSPPEAADGVDLSKDLKETVSEVVEEIEDRYLRALLTSTAGRIQAAADRAGISRRTLLRKLRLHGIDKARFRD